LPSWTESHPNCYSTPKDDNDGKPIGGSDSANNKIANEIKHNIPDINLGGYPEVKYPGKKTKSEMLYELLFPIFNSVSIPAIFAAPILFL